MLGERAYPSVAALPEAPDHAYILVPTEAVIDAVAECGRAGVKIATILAAGFSETGAEGVAREQRLREIAAETGIRIVGPSSLGVVNLRERAAAHRQCGVRRAGHSGRPHLLRLALRHHDRRADVARQGARRRLRRASSRSATRSIFRSARFAPRRSMIPTSTAICCSSKAIRNAAALREFALGAAARGKPVVAYKLGRSSAARELAVTHTGALAGEDDVASAFLADCGIARVESLEALIEALPLVRRTPIRPVGARPPRVAVLTTTAGGAIMVVDPLAMRGVEIAQPSAETFARFAAKGIDGDARAHRRSDHRGHALRRR